MEIDIKRLHEVHYQYPFTNRRYGKTTYVFDSLLRAAQTGFYKNLAYVTNTEASARESLKKFKDFLDESNISFVRPSEHMVIIENGVGIIFRGVKNNKPPKVEYYMTDFY